MTTRVAHRNMFGREELLRVHGLAWEGKRKKDKAVPLQAESGTEGSRKLRFSDFMSTAQDGGKVVSLTHRPPLPPGNAPGTHFCYRLRRPQGHIAIGRNMSMKNSMIPSGCLGRYN